MKIKFINIPNEKYNSIELRINNKQFGDILDDNSYIDDGFRFHDLYHLGLSEFYKFDNGVFNSLINNTPKLRSHKVEECIVLLMFEFAKSKHKTTNYIIIDTIIDLMYGITGFYHSKELLIGFIFNIYDIILDINNKMLKGLEEIELVYDNNTFFKIL